MNSLELTYNKRHLATYLLTLFTLLVWLLQVIHFGLSAGTPLNMFQSGAFLGTWVKMNPTELWRLVTANFLHFSWTHILMNVFTLFFIGRMIEEIFGSLRFVAIYLLSGIFAFTVVFTFQPNAVTAGASASIFGLFGAIAMLGFFTGSPQLKEIGKSFALLIVINLVLNLFQTGISIWGHVGGALAGGMLAAIVPPKLYASWIPKYVRLIALVLFVVLLALFLYLPFR